jgi:hypothetical protein
MEPSASLPAYSPFRWVRRLWRETLAAQEALIEVNRPWEQTGPLRWQKRFGGWELHGRETPGC